MRNVIVQMSISLDGFVAPARGAEDHRTAPEDPALKQVKLDWMRQVGTHATGDLRGDGSTLAGLDRCLRGPDERSAEGRVLKDAGDRGLGRRAGGAGRSRWGDRFAESATRRRHHRVGRRIVRAGALTSGPGTGDGIRERRRPACLPPGWFQLACRVLPAFEVVRCPSDVTFTAAGASYRCERLADQGLR